jgi:hypothetical protein
MAARNAPEGGVTNKRLYLESERDIRKTPVTPKHRKVYDSLVLDVTSVNIAIFWNCDSV